MGEVVLVRGKSVLHFFNPRTSETLCGITEIKGAPNNPRRICGTCTQVAKGGGK